MHTWKGGMMRKILMITLLLLINLYALENQGKEDSLQVITEVFAPYNYMKNGTLVGRCTGKIKLMLQELELNAIDIKVYPWFRALDEVKQKKNVLLFSIIRNSDREKKFQWVGILDSTEIGVVALSKSNITMQKTKDLQSLRTVFYSKGPLHKYLQKHGIKAQRIDEWEAAIRLLVNGRIDVYPTSLEAFFHTTTEMGYPRNMFKVIYTFPELEEKLWAAFSPSTPDTTVEKFRQALEKVNNGE